MRDLNSCQRFWYLSGTWIEVSLLGSFRTIFVVEKDFASFQRDGHFWVDDYIYKACQEKRCRLRTYRNNRK